MARWADRGIPQVREYAVPAIGSLGRFPSPPGSWSDPGPGLLDALAEATETSADDDTRYALSCLALRAGSGSIAATDGRQVTIRAGFAFPWDEDLLVRRSPLFASRELPRDQAVQIGKTDDHVAVRVGPWTIWLAIRADARFPHVDHVIPEPGSAATRLRLDPADAAFLADALGRLPGAELANGPATVDLNGVVAVRARATDQDTPTELVLSRSSYSGTPVRFQTNRAFLARAVRLGCGGLEVADADSPVVGRAGGLVFAWQPLAKDSALGPSDDVIRIESDPAPPPRPSRTMGPRNRGAS